MTTSTLNPVREGVLSNTTFPGLLYSVLRQKDTGVLTLGGDAAEKSVYIQHGRPVFAASNDRDDRLGQIFFKAGIISLEDLLGALEQSIGARKRLGTTLVEMNLIQPRDLVDGVRTQVKNIICSLFLWTRGKYRYIPGPLPSDEVITLKLGGGNVVLDGIRRIESWERIWEAVGPLTARYRTCPGTEDIGRELSLSLEEWTLLSHCEQALPLREILKLSTLTDYEICRLFWALLTLGMVTRS